MKKVIFFIFFLPRIIFCQEHDNKPIMAEGSIPQDFLTLSSEISQQDNTQIDNSAKRFEKKAKKEFIEQNSYSLRDLLFSGNVIFNDPITTYINKVADKAFAKKPELRKQLRFYTMKSTEVNAFATHNGVIFVTTGLISQLETESQLAMILCHEAVHFQNKHSITKYVENQEIIHGKGEYKTLSNDSKLLEHYKYSKDLESEADTEGLDIFLTSEYSTEGLANLFDILKYAHLPYDLVPFDKTFFESEHFIFPDDYILPEDKSKSINTDERDDDKSTHPNAEVRKEQILKKLKGKSNNSSKKYLVSESEFKEIRQLCRHEISRLYINNTHYEKAIYNAYLQLHEDSTDQFSKEIIGYALYALSTYKNEGNYYKVHGDYEKKEGDWQELYFFTEKLSGKELNILALNYNYNLLKNNPTDKLTISICDSLIKDLSFEYSLKPDDFYSTIEDSTEKSSIDTTSSSPSGKLSKINKIKNQKKGKTIEEDTDVEFWRLGLFDLMNDPSFVKTFLKYHKESEIDHSISYSQRKALIKKREKEKRKAIKKGYSFGVEKVLMIQPQYHKIDNRKNKGVRFKATEKSQLRLNTLIIENGQRSNLDVELLDDMAFKQNAVTQYNDVIYLNAWLREKAFHLTNKVNLLNFEDEYLKSIRERRGTDYFVWSGFSGIHEKKTGRWTWAGLSIFFPPALFVTLPYAAAPKYSTQFYLVVFDMKTELPIWVKYGQTNKGDSNSLVNTLLYDTFYQLHKKK